MTIKKEISNLNTCLEDNIYNMDDEETVRTNETYELWAESSLFDLAFEILEYCRKEAPLLLNKRESLNNILEVLKENIKVPCPFSDGGNDLSDDELMDEY